jgi:tyrosine-protein phosphatase YwqE
VHVFASDAHNTDRRPPRIGEAAATLGNAALAQWLTVDVPLAVVNGERLPERPAATRGRRRRIFGRS